MSSYGRTSANAISISALLAERWDSRVRTTSKDAAQVRGLSKPLAARILVMLAQAGLVDGTPGPHGGYSLARSPEKIQLSEIVSVFQKVEPQERCAYGPGWCGNGNPCPLHDEIVRLEEQHLAFLRKTALSIFVGKSAQPVSQIVSDASSVLASAPKARRKRPS